MPVDARVAPVAPARRRYEVLTPSMISIGGWVYVQRRLVTISQP
jgi:hypothetical protein